MRRYLDGRVFLQFGGVFVYPAAHARPLRCSGSHCPPTLCCLCWSHEHKDSCCCFRVSEAVSVPVEFALLLCCLKAAGSRLPHLQADPVALRECV